MLYYNLNCSKCFYPQDLILCTVKQKLKRASPEEPENIAFTLRTNQHKLLVVTDPFEKGQIQIVPYHEFINKPYVNMVKAR